MTSCPGARVWEFWWFLKKAVSWDLTLDKASWFLSLGKASPVGAYRMRRTFVGSDGMVSIVKIVCLSLSSCRKTKLKKSNVSYLNYRESSVFRVFRCIFWLCYKMIRFERICERYLICDHHTQSGIYLMHNIRWLSYMIQRLS